MKRPAGVTVVCWVLIVLSAISIISLLYSYFHFETLYHAAQQKANISQNTFKLQIQVGMAVAALNIILCVFMLKAQNWARLVYLFLGVAMQIWAFTSAPISGVMIVSLIIFVIFVYFLFNRKAATFFTHKSA
jgi:hypothetical protein